MSQHILLGTLRMDVYCICNVKCRKILAATHINRKAFLSKMKTLENSKDQNNICILNAKLVF